MKRVTGIGGVFFKTPDPEKTKTWYSKHLGFNCDQYGTTFEWKQMDGAPGQTVWSPMDTSTEYYHPSKSSFMINYRVADLEELMKVLKEEGVTIVGEMQKLDYGKFGWILDPDGNKIELWEPVTEKFAEMVKDHTTG